MITTDKGLKVYEEGDTVRIGKGKVEWVIKGLLEGEYLHLESPSGQRRYAEWGNVTLVSNIRETSPDEFTPIANDSHKVDAEEGADEVTEDLDNPVVETSAYQKAVLFALNKLQKHVYAGTVSETKKAKTRRLNGRQKASRKANR